jgi:hypothetical protein
MSNLQIIGTVEKVSDIQQGVSKAGKEWRTSGLLISTGGTYPKKCYFTVFGDELIGRVQELAEGDEVAVSFNPESREYNGRYFTENKAWRIEHTVKPSGGILPKEPETARSPEPQGLVGEDGLPF